LANDMASITGYFLTVNKDLIWTGYDRNLAEGMAYEHQISVPYNAQVSMDEVENRRLAIIERGRKLKG